MQMIMKDIETKCEGYQIRALSSEQASAVFKAERDALLAMVDIIYILYIYIYI